MTVVPLPDALLTFWVATRESPYWWEVIEETPDGLTLRTVINNGQTRTRRKVRRALVTEAHARKPWTPGDALRA